MIVKTLGLPVSAGDVDPFPDVSPGQDQSDLFYPDKYVAVVWENHITTGITPTTFGPSANVTRAQFVTMVTRAANLSDPPADYTPPSPTSLLITIPGQEKRLMPGFLAASKVWARISTSGPKPLGARRCRYSTICWP